MIFERALKLLGIEASIRFQSEGDVPRVSPYGLMEGRPDRMTYFMGFAQHAALRSKDSTKVGAVLVGRADEVMLTGYNGPPRGVQDTPDRFERPRKYLFASHAEQNIIAFAARRGICTEGCTLYVTHHPCSACARSIIQAGITRVVFGPGMTAMPTDEVAAAADMFCEAGVTVSGPWIRAVPKGAE